MSGRGPRSWPGAFVHLLGGAAGPGLVQGWLRLPDPGGVLPVEVVGFCTAGALLSAALAWPLVVLLARLRLPAQPPRHATAFWIGWGIGLAPLAHGFLFHGAAPRLMLELPVTAAVAGVVLLAAPRLGERLAPPRGLAVALVVASALSVPLAAAVFGTPEATGEPAAERRHAAALERHTALGWLLPADG
jgi:hypothetical protein